MGKPVRTCVRKAFPTHYRDTAHTKALPAAPTTSTMTAFDWNSPVGEQNALALRTKHADVFTALAEIDRLGHLMLTRAGASTPVDPANPEEWITGIGLLRRAVTTFAATRTLLKAASIDPAKALTRMHFELHLTYRVLTHGGAARAALETPLDVAGRVARGRRYRVADMRRGLRTRALLLAPNSPHRVDDAEKYDALRKELRDELKRLRANYATEWAEYGELSEDQLLNGRVGDREPAWYTASFPSHAKPVVTIKQLAHALGTSWEYDILYDALSGQVHPRGWSSDVTIDDDGVDVHHPHNPEWFAFIAFYASTWHLMLLMAAARAYAPVMIETLQQFDRTHMPAMRALDPSGALLRLA